jgi:hypothetical protein
MKSPESTSHEFGLLDLLLFVLAHAGMHSSGRIAASAPRDRSVRGHSSGQLVANLDNREA